MRSWQRWRGCPDGYTDMLFSDYMKQWLEDVKIQHSESTYEEYNRQIHNRIFAHVCNKRDFVFATRKLISH